MEKEIWKAIEGYENYKVSNLGRVKNANTGRIIKPMKKGNLAHQVTLSKQGLLKSLMLEKLILRAFKPLEEEQKYPKMFTVNHVDKNIENLRLDNLEWIPIESRRCTKKNSMKIPKVYANLYIRIMDAIYKEMSKRLSDIKDIVSTANLKDIMSSAIDKELDRWCIEQIQDTIIDANDKQDN